MDIETQNCTWWLFWSDDDWPADGVIEVQADSPRNAVEAGKKLMAEMASRDEGPQHWSWMYSPTDRKPNWIK